VRSRFKANPQKIPQSEAGQVAVVLPTDNNRSALAITLEATASSAAEALATMTLSVAGAATSTFSSRLITSGKRLRFQLLSLQVESIGSGPAIQRAYLRLRSNPSGATVAASPLQLILAAGANAPAIKASDHASLPIPDGFDLVGDGNRTFGFTLETPDYVSGTGEVRVKASILAFEF
jgi:hypothetical protein